MGGMRDPDRSARRRADRPAPTPGQDLRDVALWPALAAAAFWVGRLFVDDAAHYCTTGIDALSFVALGCLAIPPLAAAWTARRRDTGWRLAALSLWNLLATAVILGISLMLAYVAGPHGINCGE
jgi:hypothetical protein